jgi:hypothetical protein
MSIGLTGKVAKRIKKVVISLGGIVLLTPELNEGTVDGMARRRRIMTVTRTVVVIGIMIESGTKNGIATTGKGTEREKGNVRGRKTGIDIVVMTRIVTGTPGRSARELPVAAKGRLQRSRLKIVVFLLGQMPLGKTLQDVEIILRQMVTKILENAGAQQKMRYVCSCCNAIDLDAEDSVCSARSSFKTKFAQGWPPR